jgi:hypothetical protein
MPRRVILISVDDLRFDALSCEGDTRYLDRYGVAGLRDTPTLDGLAAQGTRVTQAVSTASYTPTSHASMLTGCFPPRTGVRAFLRNRLPDSVPTIAESFAGYGFHTVSAIDFGDMFGLLGLDRGFEQRFTADDGALLEHLAAHAEDPLFLFMHLVDVHPPVGESFCPPWEGYNDDFYDELERLAERLGMPAQLPRPAEIGNEQARAQAVALSGRIRTWAEDRGIADVVELPRYLAGVNKFDGGRLKWLLERFEEQGLLDGTLLVLTSDHGQGPMPADAMGDPGIPLKFDHGETVLEEVIRVPLIVRGPGIPAGAVVDRQVSLADLGPTILEWAGIEPDPEVQGRSVLELLETGEGDDSLAYAEVWYHDRAALSAYLRRSLAAGGLSPDGYETFLAHRVLRTPRHKYSRRGAELDASDWATNDSGFVRALFHKLLGRVADEAVAAELVRQLRDGTTDRERLAADFATRNAGREALYDLAADPHERVNLLALAPSLELLGETPDAPRVAAQMAEVMDALEAAAGEVPDAEAPAAAADLSKLEARLRDLGYVE